MHLFQHMVILAATNALGITNLKISKLVESDKALAPLLENEDVTGSTKRVPESFKQRRQPDGKNGCHTF